MCKFCDNPYRSLTIIPRTTIQGNLLHIDYEAYSADSNFEEYITINYCPMCGKLLEKTLKPK